MLPLPAAGAGATGDTTMSSTQHQLIEQCATRLRGIVEALDNIHDTSPQRWSTDLDDVHSSAESLLALIKDQAPARSEASFEEWLANELEGEDGQPVPAAVCDIALARRAFNHWPKLEQPAKVGGVRFSAGVSSRLVVEAAQRLYEFESTPEQEAERIERLQAFREQLDPLNLAPHAEAFNEAPAEALKPEQAEAERPEMSSERAAYFMRRFKSEEKLLGPNEQAAVDYVLSLIAQHERIVGALRFERQQMDRAFTACINERDAANARLHEVATACATAEQERDAALARVAELEKQEPVALANRGIHAFWVKWTEAAAGLYGPGIKLYAHPVAQAQHSVPEWTSSKPAVEGAYWVRGNGLVEPFVVLVKLDQGELWCNLHMRNTDTNFGYGYAVDDLSSEFEWCGPLAAATVKEVPQAWLDVQAERRRQIEAEGWTPENDDAHSHGQMARAAACYALAGSSAPNDGTAALLVSLAWPWDEQWWKPSTARRDMVKACALALAEIERLDRAAAPGKEGV